MSVNELEQSSSSHQVQSVLPKSDNAAVELVEKVVCVVVCEQALIRYMGPAAIGCSRMRVPSVKRVSNIQLRRRSSGW